MKTKVSPSIVGAFVIGAMVLAVGALFSFGGVNFFSKPQRFVVFFDESVHGLDQGSQVKLRGVRVGRVIDLNIRYDAQRNHSVIAVICEFSKNVLSDERGEPIDVSDRAELQAMIDRGLRARLEVQALATGMLFVGLNFMDPKEHPPTPGVSDPRYLVVPFVSSAIVEFQASITEILSNLKKIDFAGISKGLTALLTDIPKRLDAVDLKGMTEQWKKTGAVRADRRPVRVVRQRAGIEAHVRQSQRCGGGPAGDDCEARRADRTVEQGSGGNPGGGPQDRAGIQRNRDGGPGLHPIECRRGR
ncbi:MAG: MlaD family protein [Rhodoglobus sp.]|nr:MlaD family protein [Rhodoglobus sp.]